MFVVIVSFPPIKTGKEADFLDWFASSNRTFSEFSGFLRRRLLKPIEGPMRLSLNSKLKPPFWSCTAVPLMTGQVNRLCSCLMETHSDIL